MPKLNSSKHNKVQQAFVLLLLGCMTKGSLVCQEFELHVMKFTYSIAHHATRPLQEITFPLILYRLPAFLGHMVKECWGREKSEMVLSFKLTKLGSGPKRQPPQIWW